MNKKEKFKALNTKYNTKNATQLFAKKKKKKKKKSKIPMIYLKCRIRNYEFIFNLKAMIIF